MTTTHDKGAPPQSALASAQRPATNEGSIPQRASERTIDTRHDQLRLVASPGTIMLTGEPHLSGPLWMAPLTVAEAMELALALLELADDQRRDAVGRAWSAALSRDLTVSIES